MSVEGLVPLVIPFAIGLLAGAVVKRVAKLAVALAALIIALSATGCISLSLGEVKEKALEFLPQIASEGREWLSVLPYSSGGFLVGLALGLWKG